MSEINATVNTKIEGITIEFIKEDSEMEETTCKSVKKTLEFEKSGEILSLGICIENISSTTKKDTIISFLDRMFESIKEEI